MEDHRFEKDVRLAKAVEAGLFAQELLDEGKAGRGATAAELAVLVDEGKAAKEKFVLDNIGLVCVIAAEASRRSAESYEELFQDGCLALHEAVLRYDWKKGPFSPYAGMWIRRTIRTNCSRQAQQRCEMVAVDPDCLIVGGGLEDFHETYAMDQILDSAPYLSGEIVKLRQGWAGPMSTRREVAARFNLTVARVRTLEEEGLAFLRDQWDLAEAA